LFNQKATEYREKTGGYGYPPIPDISKIPIVSTTKERVFTVFL